MISLATKTPKILFVNPRFPRSLWGFQGIHDIVGVKCGQAPLGLATVAGMTPPEFPVELQDENVEAINFDTDADIVAIGCWSPQYLRSKELAQEFRRRGKMVVVGRAVPDALPGAVRRRHVRRGVRRRDREHLARVLPGPPRGHAAQARVQAGRQHRHAEVARCPASTSSEGRLPLLLHPDDPGLPVRVRVLRHHRHRRPGPAAEVDPPGPQGDRDHRRPRREVHQLLRREPHREPEVRRAAPGGARRSSAGRTTIPSSSPPR